MNLCFLKGSKELHCFIARKGLALHTTPSRQNEGVAMDGWMEGGRHSSVALFALVTIGAGDHVGDLSELV